MFQKIKPIVTHFKVILFRYLKYAFHQLKNFLKQRADNYRLSFKRLNEDESYRKKMALYGAFIIMFVALAGVGYRAYYKTTPDYYVVKVNEMLKEALEDKTAMQRFKISDTLKFISKGIHQFPDRLDMRIGKTYLCNSLNQVPCMERGLLNMLERAQVNKNHWQWKDGETKDETFMLNEIQSYQYRFLELQQYNEILRIAQRVIKYYPNHYQSYNTIGAVYAMNNDLDKAYDYTSKAFELAPDDPLVRQNMQILEEKKKQKEQLAQLKNSVKAQTQKQAVAPVKKTSKVHQKASQKASQKAPQKQKRATKKMKRFRKKTR